MKYAVWAAQTLAKIRERGPRVHCITNDAAQVLSANMLLAVGAVPSLTLARDEVGEFVAGADALLVNLGTLDERRRAAIDIALEALVDQPVPWLLDPVFADRSQARAAVALEMVARGPTILRANEAEFAFLAAARGAGLAEERGGGSPDAFAGAAGLVVARSGRRDHVTDGVQRLVIENGHELMSRVTAVGCAGTAVMAAFAAFEDDPFLAATGAMIVLGVAGEVAAEGSAGPGTFHAKLLDALYTLDEQTICRRAKFS